MSPCYINLVWSGICLALICHQKNLSIFFFFMCWINSVDSTLFISWWNRRIYLCSISTCLINIVHLIVKQKNLIWFYFHIVESTLLISWWNSLLLLSLSTTCLCLPRGHVTFQSPLICHKQKQAFLPFDTSLSHEGVKSTYRSHI